MIRVQILAGESYDSRIEVTIEDEFSTPNEANIRALAAEAVKKAVAATNS